MVMLHVRPVDLFTIQLPNGLYWICSSEHGSGWTDQPKQTFSKSELCKQIALLIEHGWFHEPITIERVFRRDHSEPQDECAATLMRGPSKEWMKAAGDREDEIAAEAVRKLQNGGIPPAPRRER